MTFKANYALALIGISKREICRTQELTLSPLLWNSAFLGQSFETRLLRSQPLES